MLLGTLDALGNPLAGKEVIQAGERTIRAGHFLMTPHPLTSFEK